jgi:corrinoid protein of di/trimethylamine methyltransferase
MSGIFEQMRISVLEGDEDNAIILAQKVLDEKIDLLTSMNEGFLKGIKEAGDLYESGEYYLPELVCSADAMKAALGILNPALKSSTSGIVSHGKVLLATVQGDIHDIGKTIVGAMLTASGYEIIDLGADVKNELIISSIIEYKPDVVGLSALLTTTMEEQRNVIKILEERGLRNNLKVIVGGAPANQEWANRISADGYSDNAIEAVRLVDRLLG